MRDDTAKAWAILFARGVLGLIFFMAGVWKVFVLGPVGHVERFFLPFKDSFLPIWSLFRSGFTIPFVELIGGAMVIIGLRTRIALVSLGWVLVIVTFGHLLEKALYPFHENVIPRLALVLFLLVMPRDLDRYSLDALLTRAQRTPKPVTSPMPNM